MERYKIFCTEEQTRKAKELGAPIKTSHNRFDEDVSPICQEGEGWLYAVIPTAEQMIGWLEENTEIKRINIVRGIDDHYYWDIFTSKKIASSYNGYIDGYFTRKDATIEALDAALEYLSKNNK